MSKKYKLYALIAVIAVQLAVPIGMIANKYVILSTGKEFKFKVMPIDPYDPFRGRYVSLYVQLDEISWDDRYTGRYGLISTDNEGFAYISQITKDKPNTGEYIKSDSPKRFNIPIDRYYMDEKLAPQAEIITRTASREKEKDAYVTVRVKNGALVVSGLYIDGVSIEDIIR